ncbi:histidinol-phosphate transaminase [Natranaerobius thermophilus]|uniref:Histidinol-phosphate aminotransferase n=2 Tax=Natranaerobius TaxID=375928 RepID=B2A725_NATTJ|nr:histidinol-phosphate transaminase [Natranaerobius thermophilus]ACB85616.1 histidinol-phosphate aminotransferase [Natranaerobius thermophilus JW/NM-WN-LF]
MGTKKTQFPQDSARKVLNEFSPYIPGKSLEEIKEKYGLDKVIKLASNENPHGPSPKAVKKLTDNKDIHLYPQKSYQNLQSKISQKLGTNPGQVIIGNGSDEIIKLLAAAFINPGEEGLMADITFPIYKMAVKELDGKVTHIPLKKYTHDIDQFIAQITDNTKLIFICNPNNPTGSIITHEEAEKLLSSVSKDTIVVFDEAYREYVTNPEFPKTEMLVDKYPNLIALRTFSKIYGLAALRVGYGIGSEKLIEVLHKVKLPFNVNELGLRAAQEALDDTEHLNYSKEQNDQGKKWLESKLKSSKFFSPVPSQANFLLVKTEFDAEKLAGELLKQGVIIREGTSFGMPDHFRITIGSKSDNEFFIEKLSNCEVNLK